MRHGNENWICRTKMPRRENVVPHYHVLPSMLSIAPTENMQLGEHTAIIYTENVGVTTAGNPRRRCSGGNGVRCSNGKQKSERSILSGVRTELLRNVLFRNWANCHGWSDNNATEVVKFLGDFHKDLTKLSNYAQKFSTLSIIIKYSLYFLHFHPGQYSTNSL